jgi:hypothetical protein
MGMTFRIVPSRLTQFRWVKGHQSVDAENLSAQLDCSIIFLVCRPNT